MCVVIAERVMRRVEMGQKILKDLKLYLDDQCKNGLTEYEESLPDNLALMQHIREKIIELESKYHVDLTLDE